MMGIVCTLVEEMGTAWTRAIEINCRPDKGCEDSLLTGCVLSLQLLPSQYPIYTAHIKAVHNIYNPFPVGNLCCWAPLYQLLFTGFPYSHFCGHLLLKSPPTGCSLLTLLTPHWSFYTGRILMDTLLPVALHLLPSLPFAGHSPMVMLC